VKFTASHVLFISKSNSGNYIEIRWFLMKLQTKISWLHFYGTRCIKLNRFLSVNSTRNCFAGTVVATNDLKPPPRRICNRH